MCFMRVKGEGRDVHKFECVPDYAYAYLCTFILYICCVHVSECERIRVAVHHYISHLNTVTLVDIYICA